MSHSPTGIQTYTGVFVDPFAPDPDSIRIEDIAHALSLQCRFSGHVRRHWSVAAHSCLVSDLCPVEHALAGLLHDATEAYLVDVPRPVKHHPGMAMYREAETALEAVVAARFGVTYPWPSVVLSIDRFVLGCEARALLHGTDHWSDFARSFWEIDSVVSPLSEADAIATIESASWQPPDTIERRFLAAFRRLVSQGENRCQQDRI
ncbi:MAG: phosphohydrolase [Cyanobacteria bacterium REEB65]|nr:phosphohydrolase [Cyanobacteria bacterium REEB65]